MRRLTMHMIIFLLLQIFGILTEKVVTNEDLGRRHVVPVIFVRGNNYEIGYDVGRVFGSLIRNFIANNERLKEFEIQYKTENGKEAYDRTLTNMKKRYPQYVNEIQGTADGAQVPFHQLFLLHLDDIIDTVNDNHVTRNDTGGCSSIAINGPTAGILGHTEDAFSDVLNHFYILSAHVIPSDEDKSRGAVEERFSSLCYAGQLPGYTMGYNENGLVFSINTLSPRVLKPGNTPRTFITRAVLGAKNKVHAEKLLADDGLGTANGFSINMLWTDGAGHRKLYNAEVAPNLAGPNSLLNVKFYEDESTALIHCNRYQRLKVTEVKGPIIDSSADRLKALHSHPTPSVSDDIINILSDTSGQNYKVFEERKNAIIHTIAAGVFNLYERTWSIYIGKPNISEPVAVLPIIFTSLE